MAYSMPKDVRNALAPGDWEGDDPPTNTHTAADLSDAQLEDEIREADERIDTFLSRYYQTPVAFPDAGPVPAPLNVWSRNLAAYSATLTYRKGRDLAPTDPVALRYAQTMSDMVAVRNGSMTLVLPGNTSGLGASAGAPINPYGGTLFGPSDFDLAAQPANYYPPYRSW